jgi:hypothetical protein
MYAGTERRRRRSRQLKQALLFQLDACREEGLEAMVLADEDGMCVAASGGAPVCEEIAAYASLVARKVGEFAGVIMHEQDHWDVHLQRIEAGGGTMLLCAVGGQAAARAREVQRSAGAVARILAS